MLGSGAGGTTRIIRNVMLGARDCHSTRRRSAGNAVGVPKCTCAQCGGMWGTRLDAEVTPGASLDGAVLEVSPGGKRRRGPERRPPSHSLPCKKWPDSPPHKLTPWLQIRPVRKPTLKPPPPASRRARAPLPAAKIMLLLVLLRVECAPMMSTLPSCADAALMWPACGFLAGRC